MKACFLLFVIIVIALNQQGHGKVIHEEILNGYNAVRGQFPYQVLLKPQSEVTGGYLGCGGSLISTEYVLTAAHCLYQTNHSRVYVGEVDSDDKTGVKVYDVTKDHTTIHPQFNHVTFLNDLAIMKLPRHVTTNQYVGVIQLPTKAQAPSNTFDNQMATASGWGQIRDGQKGTYHLLQYRTIHIYNHSQCVDYYGDGAKVTDGMICTDKKVVYAGPCHGDSGGPLTVNGTDGKPIQVGCVSWGVGNCTSKNPMVYSNVAYYLDWIHSVTGIPIS